MPDLSLPQEEPQRGLITLAQKLRATGQPSTLADLVTRLREVAAPYTSSALAMEALRSGLTNGELVFDPNGHWESGRRFESADLGEARSLIGMMSVLWEVSEEQAAILAAALASRQQLAGEISIGRAFLTMACSECGEEVEFTTDARQVRVKSACPLPNGIYPIQFDLNVPSGKIVFANTLGEYFPVAGHFDIMQQVGILKTTQRYAEEGMAYCFMPHPSGATGSFAVNRLPLGILQLEPLPMRFRGIADADMPRPMLEPQGGPISVERLGEVAVSAVWWSAADYDELEMRFEGTPEAFKSFLAKDCLVVDVEPGLYRVNHFDQQDVPGDEFGISRQSFVIRIADAREKNSLRVGTFNISAGQVLWQTIRNYPGQYFPQDLQLTEPDDGLQDLGRALNRRFAVDALKHADETTFKEAWARLSAEQQIVTLGRAANAVLLRSSYDWDKGGWCTSDGEVALLEDSVPIPQFPPGLRWDVVAAGFSTISRAVGMEMPFDRETGEEIKDREFIEVKPKFLNQSFRELAFNVLQSILRGGVPAPEGEENKYQCEQRENSLRIARMIFKRLAKSYPADVPVYCADLVE